MEEHNKEEYMHQLDALRHTDGVTQEDIRVFEKTALIVKSVEHVRARAAYQEAVRRNGSKNYSHVKSKVARCIKVQKKVARKKNHSPIRVGREYGIDEHSHPGKDDSYHEGGGGISAYSHSMNLNSHRGGGAHSPRAGKETQKEIDKINQQILQKQLE
jgi:hypothetical protein